MLKISCGNKFKLPVNWVPGPFPRVKTAGTWHCLSTPI